MREAGGVSNTLRLLRVALLAFSLFSTRPQALGWTHIAARLYLSPPPSSLWLAQAAAARGLAPPAPHQ